MAEGLVPQAPPAEVRAPELSSLTVGELRKRAAAAGCATS
eukprot:COSAG03_NODE_23364_length_280_cov_1.419890_1_plen_39_part_10